MIMDYGGNGNDNDNDHQYDDDDDDGDGDDDEDDDDDDSVVTSLANLTHLLSVSRASSKLFGFANGVFAVTF